MTVDVQALLERLGISDQVNQPKDAQSATATDTLTSLNPSDGTILATLPSTTLPDVAATITTAKFAHLTFRLLPAPKRGQILLSLLLALRAAKSDLGLLITLEMGKITSEGQGEVQEIIDILEYAIGLGRSLGGTLAPSEREGHWITEVANPLGVVGVISAFNFPMAVFGWNFALSFICGNATIWKPSPTTPLCALALTHLIHSVLTAHSLPTALCSLILGGKDVGEALVDSKLVDLVSFTGSERVGREVGVRVAGRFGQSILELGGNNAAIVMPDANLSLALPSILFASLGTTGQRCTTTRRLLLHRSIAATFLASLCSAFASASTRIGRPEVEGTLVGPLHSRDAVRGFVGAVGRATEEGGVVKIGGKVREVEGQGQGGNWVEPTVIWFDGFEGVEVVREETFAPILYVTQFDTLEEAIAINNSVEQGLSSALFTKDIGNVFKWIGPGGSDCGIVNVNGSTSGAEVGARFGGNKSTGWGRECGGEAWKQYCRWASCTINFSDEVGLAQGVSFD